MGVINVSLQIFDNTVAGMCANLYETSIQHVTQWESLRLQAEEVSQLI